MIISKGIIQYAILYRPIAGEKWTVVASHSVLENMERERDRMLESDVIAKDPDPQFRIIRFEGADAE